MGVAPIGESGLVSLALQGHKSQSTNLSLKVGVPMVESTEARLERALELINALEKHRQELVAALQQHRLVLEHYMSICATVQADPAPAAEVLSKYQRLNQRPLLRSVK